MSNMREAFEAFYEDAFAADYYDEITLEVMFSRDGDTYKAIHVDEAWGIWQAAQSVPGFVLVPVESARVCATLAKLHFDRVQRHFAADDKFPLSENWQPHINALLDAVEQEKKNG